LPFVVKTASVEERSLSGEPPTEFVLRMSQAKALALKDARPNELIVAADTIVVLGTDVLGKPDGPDEAVRMLRALRGRSHIVYSGISVWHATRRHMVCELSESLVWMRDYTDEEIDRYVQSGDPLDKAGAYAIQNPDFDPVSWVDGCRLNVVGLPLCHLRRALEKFGVVIPASLPGACQAFGQHECTVAAEVLG
jgi:MAF protein